MHKFPRYRGKAFGLLFTAGALFMMVSAARTMFPLNLGDGPVWTKIFLILFISCWYSLLLVFALYGLRWLHSIEIDDCEIRVCLGRLVLRRIPLEQVKTVGISVVYSKHDISTVELVLSKLEPCELAERGQKYLKRKRIRKWMFRAGVSDQGPDAAAKACLFESRKGILLRMEQTMEAESILRLRLHFASFLL